MPKMMRNARRGERGAAAVEFALIAPLLFMIIFGITEFGLAWSQKQVFIQAAREGARYAAVGCESPTGCPSGQVAARVSNAATGYQVSQTPQVSPSGGCNTANTSTVTVFWNQDFSINIPFIPPRNVTSRIEAVFRCEV